MNAEYYISRLNMKKHPEGGFYSEIYKHGRRITDCGLQGHFPRERHLATSIYFLLRSGEVSKFHRLKSDEIWYFHAGTSSTVYIIDGNGVLEAVRLGIDLEAGERPQVIIPSGCIFGAAVNCKNSFTLAGCMVSPGFDFEDFELLSRDTLLENYPQHEDVIMLLT